MKDSKTGELTVLSFGAGQDSTALLLSYIYFPDFREKYATGKFIVVFANTRNEHPSTYEHLEKMQALCEEYCIEFYCVDKEWRTGDWREGLISFYEKGNRVGSKAFPKTCTDRLKVQPIYHFLEWYIHINYDAPEHGRKRATKWFAKENGKINMLLGIAKGEERRATSNEDSPSVWMRQAINKIYPLLDMGWDRAECQSVIKHLGYDIPIPSACIICPFMNDVELLHLYRLQRPWYNKWVDLEANKIKSNQHKGDKNLGVWGKKLLPEKLEEVQGKYGHMSDEELIEYRMSHGHCVASKY